MRSGAKHGSAVAIGSGAGAGLKKLFGRLQDAGIEALGPVMTEAPDTEKAEELKQKVLKRAEMIRTRWQDIPAPPIRALTYVSDPAFTDADPAALIWLPD